MIGKLSGSVWAPLLVATVVGGAIVTAVNSQFATSYNIFVVLQGTSGYAVIGFSAMVVLALRDITLAVAGIASATGVFFGWLVQDFRVPVVAAALATLVVGLAAGWLNGMIVTRTGLTGFVATLATGAAFTGLALGFTQSYEFSNIPDSWTNFGQGRVGFFPEVGFIALAVAGLLAVLYRWLPLGRNMLATGGNPEAARLAGIAGGRQLVWGHALSGVLAAVAALMYVGTIGSASPNLGESWILISFAVPIIGGTALAGGRVSVGGALAAALVLATINDVLILLNVSEYSVTFAQGILILVAVLAGRLQGFGLLRRGPRGAAGNPIEETS